MSVLFLFFSVLFCVCLITANVLETKQISIGMFNITGGLLVFPVSYIINDCVCEVWGYAPYWHNDEGFHAVFGLAPRIAAASFVAFLVGSFVNAYVMSRMKISSEGRNFSLRAILSTVFGEGADSLIFFPLALYGVVPTSELPIFIVTQVVLKTVYEMVVLPVTL